MSTNPNKLDVLDSKISDEVVIVYKNKVFELEAELKEFWRFEIVPNEFKQSLDDTDDNNFDHLNEHFGSISQWKDIIQKLEGLNTNKKANESYKLLFLARHGQGFHNMAHSRYGNNAWNQHWSKINGNGEIVWGPDPLLTDLGLSQAKENQAQWKIELSRGAPLPTKWFVSPFRRSIDTLINTWNEIVDLKKVKPLIRELLREQTGVHTCDKRSPKSVIEPYESLGFVIEDGFADDDIFYSNDYRETIPEHAIRQNCFFQQLFSYTPDSVVSITSHSGTIRAQLLALGHRPFAVSTGGMIPVLVKAIKHSNS